MLTLLPATVTLQHYIASRSDELTETEAMNALQDHGVISDRCVWAASVHVDDQPAAVAWLREHPML